MSCWHIYRSCFKAEDEADVEKQVDNLADSSASNADSTVESQKAENIESEVGAESTPADPAEDSCGTTKAAKVRDKKNNTDGDDGVDAKESTLCCSMA